MVHAVETNLQKLLEGTKQYRVPLYQRTYAWHEEPLRRLWGDLLDLTEDRLKHGSDSTHFMGSLVLAPSPVIGPAGLQEFLVVDGQQRLTTLTLLLAAIRDHRSETESPSHIERINEKYLVNKWEDGQPTKVLPTQADRDSYLACIRRTPHAGGSDRVGAAYRFFRARLTEFDDPEDELDVQRLEEAVIAGLSLVCVTAQAGDNAHRIFESLNNTGLRLTQGDLIRNYLFMRLPTRAEHVYKFVWLPLQERLTAQELELLFWLDLVQTDDAAKQGDTYALQQKRLDRLLDESEIEADIERLARLGDLLQTILHPDGEPNPAVRSQLERLNAWGTTTVYPVLLHLLDRRQRGAADDDSIIAAMRTLESFFVRRVVIGQATKNINRILLRAVPEIRDSEAVSDALRDYLSAGRKFFATDSEIRAAVRAVPFYWNGRAHQRNLILQWLELSHGSKEPAALVGLTVEHVLPQTLTASWIDMLSVELSPDEDVAAVHQSIVHTIGNLTLTGYNSELSNGPLEQKRPKLQSSALQMNHEIASHETWTRSSILARADQLADRIIDLWPGPSEVVELAHVAPVWSMLNQVLAAIPAGHWASYGDVAAVIGTHPVPLGQRLANFPAISGYRVLLADGTIAPSFRWLDEMQTQSAEQVLSAEGVRFIGGRADVSQRLTADELAMLAGLDQDDQVPGGELGDAERRDLFLAQLAAAQDAETVHAVRATMTAWEHLGGFLEFGQAAETSCFLSTSEAARQAWPLTLYPSGAVEVVFQHMTGRPPFDDAGLRARFRELLNLADGIDIPESRLELRPSFHVTLLKDSTVRDRVVESLAWFIDQCRQYARQQSPVPSG